MTRTKILIAAGSHRASIKLCQSHKYKIPRENCAAEMRAGSTSFKVVIKEIMVIQLYCYDTQAHLVYRARFPTCVRTYISFNFSKTARRTNIKPGTIYHHLKVSVMKALVTLR